MARATFDDIHFSVRNAAQHLRTFGAHVLRPGMTGEMQGDAAGKRPHPIGQAFFTRQFDDIFGDIIGLLCESLDRRIVWRRERPFVFQHQGARRHEGDDVIALIEPGPKLGGHLLGVLDDLIDRALLPKRHAAA